MSGIIIPTPREGVVLRSLSDEEYVALHESLDSPTIEIVRPEPGVTDILGDRKLIAESYPEAVQVGIVDASTIVGEVSLAPYGDQPCLASIGWSVVRSHQRRGYATTAAQALVDFGIKEIGVDIVLTEIEKVNVPSRGLAEKLGFTAFAESETRLYFGYVANPV